MYVHLSLERFNTFALLVALTCALQRVINRQREINYIFGCASDSLISCRLLITFTICYGICAQSDDAKLEGLK